MKLLRDEELLCAFRWSEPGSTSALDAKRAQHLSGFHRCMQKKMTVEESLHLDGIFLSSAEAERFVCWCDVVGVLK